MNKKLEQQIINLYEKGLSAYKIMDSLNISSKNLVYKILHNHKIVRDYVNSRHACVNSNYFNRIDTAEKAYWLGFLYADGCVCTSKSKYRISIGLHPKDKHLLKDLKITLNLSNKIQHTKQPLCVLQFSNKQMVKDLIKHGCIPQKTLKLTPPTTVPRKYIYDFIRGIVDGDGSIYQRYDGRFGFNITGTQRIVEWIKLQLNITSKTEKIKNSFKVSTMSKDILIKIYELLYKNEGPFLKRKKEIFDDFKAAYS